MEAADLSNKKQLKAISEEQNRTKSEIDEIRASLGEAYTRFNNMSDPELMDACIYEISALRSHYNNAMRRQKNLYI